MRPRLVLAAAVVATVAVSASEVRVGGEVRSPIVATPIGAGTVHRAPRVADLVPPRASPVDESPSITIQTVVTRRALADPVIRQVSATPVPPVRAEAVRAPVDSASVPQEVLVELRFGRVRSQTVVALRESDEALLPIRELLTLGEYDFTEDSLGVVHIVEHLSGRRTSISRDGTVLRNETPVTVDSGHVVPSPTATFVSRDLLGQLFGLRTTVEWQNLRVTIMNIDVTPLGQRLERERRRRMLFTATLNTTPDLRLDPLRVPLDGFAADWTLFSTLEDPVNSLGYRLAVGAQVYGGSLELTSRSEGTVGSGPTMIDATYLQVWRNNPWLKQFRVGDAFATGPRVRSLRGGSITNAPFVRDALFAEEELLGRVGPGWEIELRQAGRVIEFARADDQGGYALDIPVRYGENPVQVVAFGPHGEVVTAERLFRVNTDRLPAGSTEYGVSVGDCRSRQCDATGNVDFRYAPTDRITLRGGVDQFWRETRNDITHVYLSATGAVSPTWQFTGEFISQGVLRSIASFTPTNDLRIRTSASEFLDQPAAPVLTQSTRERTFEADLFLRPGGTAFPDLWYRGAAVHEIFQDLRRTRLLGQQVIQLNGHRLEAGLGVDIDRSDVGPDETLVFQQAAVRSNFRLPVLGMTSIRASVETEDLRRFSRLNFEVSKRVNRQLRLDGGWTWLDEFGASVFFGLTADLNAFRMFDRATYQEQSGTVSTTQLLQGSARWDGVAGRMEFGPSVGLERGGVSGRVFLDENANGSYDTGEQTVPNVRMFVGTAAQRTDSAGRFSVWDLVAFEPTTVAIDSLSVPHPLWVPAVSLAEVPVGPSSYRRYDLPLALAGEISGQVILDQNGGIGGVRLALINLDTGTETITSTFSDGEFYLLGIRPGRYELRIDPEPLVALGLRPEEDAVPLFVDAVPGGQRISGLVLALLRVNGQ